MIDRGLVGGPAPILREKKAKLVLGTATSLAVPSVTVAPSSASEKREQNLAPVWAFGRCRRERRQGGLARSIRGTTNAISGRRLRSIRQRHLRCQYGRRRTFES